MQTNNYKKAPGVQKTLLGIAVAFYGIYKFVLTDADIIKNLGVAYPVVMMVWVVIMLFSAGFSGWSIVMHLTEIKEKFKKEDAD